VKLQGFICRKGGNVFQHVELCIINLTIDSDSITWTYLFGGQGEIDCLTKMLPRLKRYPKVETR